MFKRIIATLLAVVGIQAKAASPDFSEVDSLAKAQQLYRDGKLEKLYLFPLDLGGEDIPQNVVYVPVGIGQFKAQLDGTVRRWLKPALCPSTRPPQSTKARVSSRARSSFALGTLKSQGLSTQLSRSGEPEV